MPTRLGKVFSSFFRALRRQRLDDTTGFGPNWAGSASWRESSAPRRREGQHKAAAGPSSEGDGSNITTCPIGTSQPSQPHNPLCAECSAEQRRLFWMEAFGGGFFFVAVAAMLYLLGRWYVG